MAASDDFADSFGESMASPDQRGADGRRVTRVSNQRFDEAHELSGDLDESVDTHAQSMSMQSPGQRAPPGGRGSGGDMGDSPPRDEPGGADRSGYPPDDLEIPDRKRSGRGNMRGAMAPAGDDSDEEDTEDEASGAGAPAVGSSPTIAAPAASAASASEGGAAASASSAATMPRGYNPADYSNLSVSREIQELFGHIDRYKPHLLDLPTRLKPFIPDFTPSVGDIDPFLKPARPDGNSESLGLSRLDEPASQQSDATVLELQLRALSKKSHLEPTAVRSIPDADKNPREVQRWIDSVEELHRTKPPPQVRYSKPMPDVEALMQEWPAEVEELLQSVESPSADMDLSLEEMSRLACALTGVPVHGSDSLVQSLHVLFTLYAEFRANQHFQVGPGGAAGPDGPGGGAAAAGFG